MFMCLHNRVQSSIAGGASDENDEPEDAGAGQRHRLDNDPEFQKLLQEEILVPLVVSYPCEILPTLLTLRNANKVVCSAKYKRIIKGTKTKNEIKNVNDYSIARTSRG